MLSMVYFHCKTIRNAENFEKSRNKIIFQVILGLKNLKKVLQNPGGTDRTKGKISGMEDFDFAVSDRSSILMASDG